MWSSQPGAGYRWTVRETDHPGAALNLSALGPGPGAGEASLRVPGARILRPVTVQLVATTADDAAAAELQVPVDPSPAPV